MTNKTFEQFLMDKHSEVFVGTKEMEIEDFPDWLAELGVDEVIEYADKYVKEAIFDQEQELEKEHKWQRVVESGLKEIIKGEGAYNRDRLIHAVNTIKNMKQIATDLLKAIE